MFARNKTSVCTRYFVFISLILAFIISLFVTSPAAANQADTSNDGSASPSTHAQINTSSVRIHVLPFLWMDAIVLESNGHFAMVDSGEDNDFPSGNDPRYPLRSGITRNQGVEDEVIAYLRSLGVTPQNFDFYIGTHPHSDHIGTADEIINAFKPALVYTPYYDDSIVTNPANLWDNQYVYDHLMMAAQNNGARIIQTFDTSLTTQVSDIPLDDGTYVGNPVITLGNATIEIMNYQHNLDAGVNDCNDYSWGVLVSAYGKKAFLAGDINNYHGDEDRLAAQLGRVDLLKLGHHGALHSNTANFLQSLRPHIAIVTGNYRGINSQAADLLESFNTAVFTAEDAANLNRQAIVVTISSQGITSNMQDNQLLLRLRNTSPIVLASINGVPTIQNGWVAQTTTSQNPTYYWFDNSPYATESSWIKDKGSWYYLKDNATMARGWQQVDGSWYWLDNSGAMLANRWIKVSGVWYYLKSNGAMATGWQNNWGTWYYLDPQSGAMREGWQLINNQWYYLNYDSGDMATGWKHINGSWYYLRASGAMHTGWGKINGSWYYLNPSGAMATGWKLVNGSWYYLRSSGAMATGWLKVAGSWYYLNPSGAMATGWKHINNEWYYLKSSGAMHTGWLKLNNTWYYLNSSGAMVTGGATIDGVWYTFNASGALQ